MKILVASATGFEVDQFRQYCLQNCRAGTVWPEIDFLITGVGMMATAVQLSFALQQKQFDLVIQAGVGGCFDEAKPLGSVFVVSHEVIGDLGVEENGVWKDLFDMKLNSADSPPFVNRKIPGFMLPVNWRPPFEEATAITVNEITTQVSRINQLLAKYDPVLESMEGAALHFAGHHYQVPFVQLRAISNYVGERDKTKWRMKEAITNLNESLNVYLKQFTGDNL